MKRACRLMPVLIAALMLLLSSAAEAKRYGDIEILETSPRPRNPEYGYAEHAFVVVNHSADQLHRVTLTAPQSSGSQSAHRLTRLSRTVEVAPGTTSRVSIPQPPVALGGLAFTVSIDGREQDEGVMSSSLTAIFSSSMPGSASDPYMLGSARAMSVPGVSQSVPGRGTLIFGRNNAPLAQWSRQWLAYSAYAAVVVTAEEWEDAPPEVRQTVLDYVRAGGVLALLGTVDLPGDREGEAFDGGRTATLGFGTVMEIQRESLDIDNLRSMPWLELVNEASQTDRALRQRMSINDANRAFTVRDDIEVPVQSLFVLLLLFAVAAGPVNLVLLTRKRRRIWLLWTTPLISLVFCGSVFAYSILAHGITPTVRIETVTLLDQESHRATTLGWLGYYAPLSPGTMVFDDRTELTPQLSTDTYNEPGRGRAIEWAGSEQRLGGGWVAPGVPSHFRVRRVVTDRRRLQVEGEEGGLPVLVNNLEVRIERVHFMDNAGRVFKAEAIEPGASATAERVTYMARDESRRDYRTLLTRSWHGMADRDEEDHLPLLSRGGYVAVLQQSPFIDPALPRYDTRPQQSLVIGQFGSGDLPPSFAAGEPQP